MKNVRILAFAAVGALALGLGTAMAQEGANSSDESFWVHPTASTPRALDANRGSGVVRPDLPQAGSSDRPALPPTSNEAGDVAD